MSKAAAVGIFAALAVAGGFMWLTSRGKRLKCPLDGLTFESCTELSYHLTVVHGWTYDQVWGWMSTNQPQCVLPV